MRLTLHAFAIVLVVAVSLPEPLQGQSLSGRKVVSESEYEQATESQRQEILDNPNKYVVVKDGKKVDIWTVPPGDTEVHGTVREAVGKAVPGKDNVLPVEVVHDLERKQAIKKEQNKQTESSIQEQENQERIQEAPATPSAVEHPEDMVPRSEADVPTGGTLGNRSDRIQEGNADEALRQDRQRGDITSPEVPVEVPDDFDRGQGRLSEEEFNRLTDQEQAEYIRALGDKF